MSKYTELELALNELLRLYEEDVESYGVEIPETFDYCRAKEALLDLPTIDIVNCIECAYLGEDWWCYKHEFTPLPIEDFFCKDGERIEE